MYKYKIGQIIKDDILKGDQYPAMILAQSKGSKGRNIYWLGHTDCSEFYATRSEEELDMSNGEFEELTVAEISKRLGKTIKVIE